MNYKGLKIANGKITQECFPYKLVIEPKSSQDPDLSLLWELDQNISKLKTVNRILFLSNLENDGADVTLERMSFVKQAENSIT